MTKAGNGSEIRVIHEGGRPVLQGYDPLEQETVNDPSAWLAAARAATPIFYVPAQDQWVVARYRALARIFTDTENFTSVGNTEYTAPPEEVAGVVPNGWAMEQFTAKTREGEPHTRKRQLYSRILSQKRACQKTEVIRTRSNLLVDRFVALGNADLVTAYCHQIPVGVMASILGFPPEDEPNAFRWTMALMDLMGNPYLEHEEVVRVALEVVEFEQYVATLIEERRRNLLEDDFISTLILTQTEYGELSLTDREMVGLIVQMIFAGSDTSASALGLTLHHLLSDRRCWEELLGNRELLESAVEEGLRVGNPVRGSLRVATKSVEVDGIVVPKGARLRMHTWSADRDEEVFEQADQFDMHRSNARDHITFGRGPRFCPGAHLARREIYIAIETLLDRVPSLRLRPDSTLRFTRSQFVPTLLGGVLGEWDERV